MRTLSWMRQELGQPTVYLVDWTCRIATTPKDYLPAKLLQRRSPTIREARVALGAMLGLPPVEERTMQGIARWMEDVAVPGKIVDPGPIARFVRKTVDEAFQSARKIRGSSPKLLHAILQVIRLAQRGVARVLLEGETGVGKELLATLFAEVTGVEGSGFQAVNCAALPDTLLETLMFGVVKGVATGVGEHPGVVANAKVLFLDEVEALPVEFQVKLLRFLDAGYYRPLGGLKELRSDVKIIAATNQPLEQLVQQHRFRNDVYFRLTRGGRIRVPSLKARPSDISEIARYLADRREVSLDESGLAALKRLPWPGNVRQLDAAIEAAASESVDGILTLDDFAAIADLGAQLVTLGEDFTRRLLADLRKQPQDELRGRLARCLPVGLRRFVYITSALISVGKQLLTQYRVVRAADDAAQAEFANGPAVANWILLAGRALGLHAGDPSRAVAEPGELKVARDSFRAAFTAEDWVRAHAALAVTPPESPLWAAFRAECEELRAESVRQLLADIEECRAFVKERAPHNSEQQFVLRNLEVAVEAVDVVDRILALILAQLSQGADVLSGASRFIESLLRPSAAKPDAKSAATASTASATKGPLHASGNAEAFRQRYRTLKGQGLSESDARAELVRESGKSLGSINRALRVLALVKKRRPRGVHTPAPPAKKRSDSDKARPR